MKQLFILLILISGNTYAQNQNCIWIFGDSAGVDFSNINNPLPIISGMDGRGSCASIADTNSSLLFYGNTSSSQLRTFLQDATNDTLLASDPMPGNGLYNELVIIPKPRNTILYYIFYTGVRGFVDTTYYALIDMTLNNGLGEMTLKNQVLDVYRPGDCLTAVKHGNGRDWWVIGKLADDNLSQHNRFYKYLVTPDSIIHFPFQDFNDATDADFQKIIWRPDYNRFMLINIVGYMSEFEFDRCDGTITLIRNIFPEQPSNFNRLFWEGAYSPNGNIFYVSTDDFIGVPIMNLLQYDLLASDIPASVDTLDTWQDYTGTGAVRLAPNNKIYFSRACQWGFPYFPYPDSVRNYINENLSVINSPDSLGAACDYQPFSFYLGGKRTYYGLPNNPKYDLGALTGSVCDSLTSGVVQQVSNSIKGRLYPNPASDKIIYQCNLKNAQHVELLLTNAMDDAVLRKKLTDEKTELVIHHLPPGIYFYRVVADGKVLDNGKVVIIK
jgi:hypothetical protein